MWEGRDLGNGGRVAIKFYLIFVVFSFFPEFNNLLTTDIGYSLNQLQSTA